MPKGSFTQGVCLLTNGQTTIEQIKSTLLEHGFKIAKEVPCRDSWAFGGTSVVTPFLPDVNGYLEVDVVNHPWPDTMGDTNSETMIFCAWSMGFFGPFTYPGGLVRAGQHAWGWAPARTIAEGHCGFIRLRTSYVFGVEKDAPCWPEDYDPLAEMFFLSRAVLALLTAPGVICYFNPNGEVLRDGASFSETWEAGQKQEKLPLPLWMNIRSFSLNEEFGFMDTVGNGQLDVSDFEAIFPYATHDLGDIDYYLRNVTHYLLDLGRGTDQGRSANPISPSRAPDRRSNRRSRRDQLVVDHRNARRGHHRATARVLRLYPKAEHAAIQQALSAVKRSRA